MLIIFLIRVTLTTHKPPYDAKSRNITSVTNDTDVNNGTDVIHVKDIQTVKDSEMTLLNREKRSWRRRTKERKRRHDYKLLTAVKN